MQSDTKKPKKRCRFDRSHNILNEVKRESVLGGICMLRLIRRGLETGSKVTRQPSTQPQRA